jgi:hypothetical protein
VDKVERCLLTLVPEHTEGNDSDDEADDGQSTSNVGQHNQSSFNCRIMLDISNIDQYSKVG